MILGHSSIETSEIYVEQNQGKAREAMRLMGQGHGKAREGGDGSTHLAAQWDRARPPSFRAESTGIGVD